MTLYKSLEYLVCGVWKINVRNGWHPLSTSKSKNMCTTFFLGVPFYPSFIDPSRFQPYKFYAYKKWPVVDRCLCVHSPKRLLHSRHRVIFLLLLITPRWQNTLCWPLTSLTLSDTPYPSPPLPGSLFTCGDRPSMSFGPLAARRFHCLLFPTWPRVLTPELLPLTLRRTIFFHVRSCCLTDCLLLLRLQTSDADRATRAGTLLDNPRVLTASSCTCAVPL